MFTVLFISGEKTWLNGTTLFKCTEDNNKDLYFNLEKNSTPYPKIVHPTYLNNFSEIFPIASFQPLTSVR